MQTILTILVVLARLVSPNPVSDENPTSPCALLPNYGSEGISTTIGVTAIQGRVPTTLSLQTLGDQLYNRVILGEYESAVTKCLQLDLEGKGQVIIDTVNKLLSGGKRNVIAFAYKLWHMFGRNIVRDYFPVQFALLLNEGSVVFVDKKHEVALNVVTNADANGNRLAFGGGKDKTGVQPTWNLKAIWEDNKVYFRIFNHVRQQYLKLGIAKESNGEHKGYSANAYDTFRHQWYLHPTMYEGELLFYIINREFNQALKLALTVDNVGNRQLFSNNGDYIGSPEGLGWYIKQLE